MLLTMNKKNIFTHRLFGAFCMPFYRNFICAFFIMLAYSVLPAKGQDPAKPLIYSELEQTDGATGKIELIQPAQVVNLLKLQIANNKLQKGIQGYRIRIFSQSGQTARQKANDTRSAFMKSFPETEAYMEYNDPNFQILVGDFRTKTEALHQYKKIAKLFPNAFIVSEMIKISQ